MQVHAVYILAAVGCPDVEQEVYNNARRPPVQFRSGELLKEYNRYTFQFGLDRREALFDAINFAVGVGVTKAALLVGPLYPGGLECAPPQDVPPEDVSVHVYLGHMLLGANESADPYRIPCTHMGHRIQQV